MSNTAFQLETVKTVSTAQGTEFSISAIWLVSVAGYSEQTSIKEKNLHDQKSVYLQSCLKSPSELGSHKQRPGLIQVTSTTRAWLFHKGIFP